jgi:hypothetical protein
MTITPSGNPVPLEPRIRPAVLNIESGNDSNVATLSANDTDQWAHLWFTLVRFPWTSLCLVPANSHASALFAANGLAAVGRRYERDPIHVIDAERIASGDLGTILTALEERNAVGTRVLVAVSSPLTHDAAIPAARAADAAVLVVRVGDARIEDARRTLDCIGSGNFIGSITVSK